MTLTLTWENFSEIWVETSELPHAPGNQDSFELVPQVGRGSDYGVELWSGMELCCFNYELTDPLEIITPVHEHEVQCLIVTAGYFDTRELYPTIGGSSAYLSGGGISPALVDHWSPGRLAGVDIHLKPELLPSLLGLPADTPNLRRLSQQDDWKLSFFPEVTPLMRQIVQQICYAPFHSVTRRLYLQGKVLELLSLMLDPVLADQETAVPLPRLTPATATRLYQAKQILHKRLENPPLLLELADQVGVSERTLQRGFRELFNTTVMGYLTQQRMQQAEQLLRSGNHTVAEVANIVGYVHLGHFAAAFKRQFGITPRECLSGRKSR